MDVIDTARVSVKYMEEPSPPLVLGPSPPTTTQPIRTFPRNDLRPHHGLLR